MQHNLWLNTCILMGIAFYYLFHCMWTFFYSGRSYLPTAWISGLHTFSSKARVNVITKFTWNSLLREAFFVCYLVVCFPFAFRIWVLTGLQSFEDFSELCICVVTTSNNQGILCLILYLNFIFLFFLFFQSAWSVVLCTQ